MLSGVVKVLFKENKMSGQTDPTPIVVLIILILIALLTIFVSGAVVYDTSRRKSRMIAERMTYNEVGEEVYLDKFYTGYD